jgi:hypothetical protein
MIGSNSDQYDGEFFITSVRYENNQRKETREWIPRTVFNDTHMGYAVVIGNGESREKFNLKLLENHRGGVLGAMACQTYGCNALSREFQCDFLVATGRELTEEIATSEEYSEKPYAEERIVYAGAEHCLKHPGKFHLIPYNVRMNAGATALYMACFDKHKNIYLIGFDGQNGGEGYNNNIYAGTFGYMPKEYTVPSDKWEASMCKVFAAYPDISFTLVDNNSGRYPDDYKWYKNVKYIDYRTFASEIDLGSFKH